ncbi:ABC transporter permease subunit [Aquibacillus halophilus]|uniref:ABC transporter permease subunit n=1 Tax=Aquibacillus halophilus TaxID=930132 RepID=A0A6A8DDZ5_9BACI|nr:ABC transporter permease subunit [Aquibacillus halophilus]MRH41137.1 ABC transporter permease subunit [Aquibacillus halophilus]
MSHDTTKKTKGLFWHQAVIALLLIYLFLPVMATLLLSLAKEWQSELVPHHYTLQWYVEIFTDVRFISAMGRSVLVSAITVIISLMIMVPAIFVIAVYLPKWEKLLQIAVLLPFAFPPVVTAIGLIKIYSSGPIAISGTIWILVGAYFILILPFSYQSIRNSLRTIHAKDLMEAAEILGAGKITAFVQVILPNILPGILISSLLSFSLIFGEFVYANLLVGGSFETIQIYLFNKMRTGGQTASAVVITYFILIFIISGFIIKLGRWKPKEYVASTIAKGGE